MKVARSLQEAGAERLETPVVTLGFFDGLHLGHQSLLRELREWAASVGGTPTVITFDRHPRRVISGTAPPAIHALEHRLLLLESQGIASTLVLPFDQEMSRWPPEEFVERVIREALGATRLLLGFDSSIGHRRRGTFEYLSERAETLGVEIRRAAPLLLGAGRERPSSTLVRDAVLRGDLDRIVELTGRPYALVGRVCEGDGRGRTIGYPTANIATAAEALVPHGVYFGELRTVRLSWEDESAPAARLERAPALVNIGRRPTFDGEETHVEAHVLDFEGDLYGARVELALHHRERDERRFESSGALVTQIRADEAALRARLGERHS